VQPLLESNFVAEVAVEEEEQRKLEHHRKKDRIAEVETGNSRNFVAVAVVGRFGQGFEMHQIDCESEEQLV
jgi:hypothetical protein